MVNVVSACCSTGPVTWVVAPVTNPSMIGKFWRCSPRRRCRPDRSPCGRRREVDRQSAVGVDDVAADGVAV